MIVFDMIVFDCTSRLKLQVEELLEAIGRNNASKVMVGGLIVCCGSLPVAVIIQLICLTLFLGIVLERDGPVEQGC
jgi:hypothetical protein